MHGEFDEVECPSVEQLTAMGGRYLAGDLDTRWASRYRRSGNAPKRKSALFGRRRVVQRIN